MAAASSKPAKEKKEKEQKESKVPKESKESKEKREKYDKHLNKAEEQIAAKNFSDAIMAYQQARLYASEEQIKKVDDKICRSKDGAGAGQPLRDSNLAAGPGSTGSTDPAADNTAFAGEDADGDSDAATSTRHATTGDAAATDRCYAPTILPAGGHTAADAWAICAPMSTYPTSGYPLEPQQPVSHYGPQYPPQYGQHYPSQPSDYPPTLRPEEYAEYVDFAQGMVAPAPVNPTTI